MRCKIDSRDLAKRREELAELYANLEKMVETLGEDESPPGSKPSATWHDILIKRAKGESDAYCAQGHLLSEKLGGPGEQKNLTPITDDANRNDHEANVETDIKRLVHGEAKGVRYEVKVILDSEAYIPSRLECRYRVVWENGKYYKKERARSRPHCAQRDRQERGVICGERTT
jgi:hypothetical protein